MIDPTAADIGRRVKYNKGRESMKSRTTTGVIDRFDRQYVYVSYDGEPKPIAAKRKNLDWDEATQPSLQAQRRFPDEATA